MKKRPSADADAYSAGYAASVARLWVPVNGNPPSPARLVADCARLVSDLLRRSPDGALFMVNAFRQGGRVGLEVEARYDASEYAPNGGRLTATAWDAPD